MFFLNIYVVKFYSQDDWGKKHWVGKLIFLSVKM